MELPSAYTPTGEVAGLDSNPLRANGTAAERPPLMARRIYVMLDEEAKLVDRALGKEGAQALIQMCKEKLGL